ncbi:unnamed protein product [Microthlaspi erraticum]|uniref:Transposase MuDR plant domain-containing protein n=1 Tax=Microthlaspi erraticum TaxID=1685480 RepID=A0A6D2KLI7_9BRAS|nr:unnamed protein product [Microthlaspi erraticum]
MSLLLTKEKALSPIMDDSNDEDDDVVPSLPSKGQRFPVKKNSTVDVRRRLFQDGENSHTGGVNQDQSDDDDDDENSDYEPDQGRRFSRWGRFEEALHQILNDFSTEPTLFGCDAPLVFTTNKGDEAELPDVPYEGDNLFVGRVFKSNNDCKIKTAVNAINRRFHFHTTRSAPNFMVMNCITPSCHWRVYTVLVDDIGNFQIRQATLKHTCSVDARRNYYRLATTQVIGELMQSKFVDPSFGRFRLWPCRLGGSPKSQFILGSLKRQFIVQWRSGQPNLSKFVNSCGGVGIRCSKRICLFHSDELPMHQLEVNLIFTC